MALVDLMARLRADPTGFKAGIASAQRDLNSFQAQTYTASRGVVGSFRGIGAAAGSLAGMLAGLGVAMSLGSLVNNAREFESAMGVIQAASGATGRELAQAESIIRDVGVSMGFGARETATAAEELLKAGLAVSDLADGALRASVVLAAATGGTMADGANIAVRAMENFNVEAAELDRVVQGAAGVINATTFDLQDYSLALGMAGNTAAAMGITLEDFNATIALTASAFSSGSDAGTSFKTFLQRMAAPTGEAAGLIEGLGISIYDAQGRFIGMEAVAERLARAFEGMTQQERARIVVAIAGADAQRTMNVLIDEGGEALARMRDETLKQANADEMAAARMTGLNGALARLSAKWEELSITLRDSGVNDMLGEIVDTLGQIVTGATAAVNALTRLNMNRVNLGDDIEGLRNQRDAHTRELARRRARLRATEEHVARYPLPNGEMSDSHANTLATYRQRVAETEERIAALNAAILDLKYPLVDVREELGTLRDPLADAEAEAERLAELLRNAGTAGADAERTITEALEAELRERQELREQAIADSLAMHRQVLADTNAALEAMPPTMFERMGAAVDGFADAVSNSLEQAFVNGELDWDNIGESLARDWRQVLWDVFVGEDVNEVLTAIARQLKGMFNQFLTDCFGTTSSGGSGESGWINAAINAIASFFGGARAGGGPVASGKAYMVGEHGPELFTAPGMGGGNIVPLHAVAGERAGGVSLTYAPAIDARGADAATVARLDRQQRDLLANFADMTERVVQSAIARRKIR